MEIRVKDDHVEIEGYVNAIERNSRPLWSRIGQFMERVCKGAFTKALERNDDVKLLLNHDRERELGSTKQGNLELHEDSIGLHARAIITDEDVCMKARNGDLVGWSFGFYDTPGGVEQSIDEETRLPVRKLRDLDLREVSILDRKKCPAYEGTLVAVRSDEKAMFISETCADDINIRESEQSEHHENDADIKVIDYSVFDDMIEDMRRE
jgi:HK97 family phage prohead protease